jgi:hypothetical protein
LAAAALAACGGDDTGTAGGGGSAGSAGTGGGTDGGTGGGTGGGGTANTGGSGGVTDGSVEAEAGCTCTGVNCTPAGVLFSFDAADAGGGTAAWALFPASAADGAGLVPQTDISSTEGHTAAGALSLTVPYTMLGQDAISIQYNYGSTPGTGGARDWSCKSAVHFWVKIGSPGDAGSIIPFLNGVQAFIQSGDPSSDAANGGGYAFYTFTFVAASMFADGAFHEIVVPFTGAMGSPVNAADINQIGVQVQPLAAPDGGTEGGTINPGTVQLFIDDISLQ